MGFRSLELSFHSGHGAVVHWLSMQGSFDEQYETPQAATPGGNSQMPLLTHAKINIHSEPSKAFSRFNIQKMQAGKKMSKYSGSATACKTKERLDFPPCWPCPNTYRGAQPTCGVGLQAVDTLPKECWKNFYACFHHVSVCASLRTWMCACTVYIYLYVWSLGVCVCVSVCVYTCVLVGVHVCSCPPCRCLPLCIPTCTWACLCASEDCREPERPKKVSRFVQCFIHIYYRIYF